MHKFISMKKMCKIFYVVVLLTTMAHAQRPFFAGGRPANGLSQKDKYNHPQLAMGIPIETTTNNIQDIANRFGGSSQNNNNNNNNDNTPQKPPVGLPVVYPETKYEPLPQKYNQLTTTESLNDDIANRFGGSATENEVVAKKPERIPFDARGDEQLVDQLSRLPVNQQPFWFINYQAIEAQRQSNNANAGQGTVGRSKFLG